MEGTRASGVFDVSLEPGWNLVGYPLWFPADVYGVEVVLGSTAFSWGEAVSFGWVSPLWTSYESETYIPTANIETWYGYWVECYASNLALRFNWENMSTKALSRWQPSPT